MPGAGPERHTQESFLKIIDTLREYLTPPWKQKFHFTREQKIIDVGWGKVQTIGYITIPIDSLYARIWTPSGLRIKPMEEIPHFQWIRDILLHKDDAVSRATYYEYSKTFFPEENPDEQLVNIKKMAIAFKSQKNIHTAPILTYLPFLMENSEYRMVLCDGTHRAAIAKVLGEKYIRCYLVNERVNYHKFA